MSRSWKRNVEKYAPDRGKWGKTQANRAVRRFKGYIPNGCWYKKLFCSYEIHDWVWDGRFYRGEFEPKYGKWDRQGGWKVPK